MFFLKKRGRSILTVFHVDANSAYLSWTAADLLEKAYPVDLRTVPAVIAGSVKERHGIILAKSIPAKKLGITTAVSLPEALKLCPSLIVFPPDYDLYLACSNAMYDILREYSPLIQRYSVDECFIDYRDPAIHHLNPVEAAFEIKDRIRRELGFTVNIGIGNNKLLAKMACEMEKPDRVHTLLTQEEIEKKLWPLDVSELFMVGRATTRKLRKININTIGDLARSDLLLMQTLFKSHGRLIHDYANGIDRDPVVTEDTLPVKSIGNGMTIRYDLLSKNEAFSYILSLCERVGTRLRAHGCKGSMITVSVCSNGFLYYSHQVTLPFYTDDTDTIYQYACRLFLECWTREPVRKLGVRVGSLVSGTEYQLSLYDASEIKKTESLNNVIDRIRLRFGTEAVYRGIFANSGLKPVEGGVNDGNYLMMGGYRQ